MAKGRRKKKREVHFFDDLSPHTKQAIGAVIFFVLGVFFVMSGIGYAGKLGIWTHGVLTYLFGTLGLILAPVACALFVYIFLKPREDEHVSISKIIGLFVFFLSSLGLFSLLALTESRGGLIGDLILSPLSYLLGGVVAGVTLGAFVIIGVFLLFNTNILNIFKKKELPEEDEMESLDEALEGDDAESEEGADTGEGPDADEETDEEPEKRSLTERMGLGKTKKGEFAVSNFKGPYAPPPLSLLERDGGKPRGGDIKANSNIIKRTLKNFNIEVEMDEVRIGPSVTRYAMKPAEGVRISKIVGLKSNLELALAASPIRIEAPIPGQSLVGIEVPNMQKQRIGLASLLSSAEYTDSPKPLLVALGKDITGQPRFANIARMPHALIAGTTGSGKSVMIHTIVTSLLFRNSPEQLRFIMVDPKRVELTQYNNIPHLLTSVITDAKKAILALKWAIKEMERRYELLESESVRDIESYHKNVYQTALKKQEKSGDEEEEELPEPLPYIVIMIDELSDLMSAYPRELEALIVRLTQKSRAIGIHLIIATQRPEVKVITGLIKANMPTRIALKVNSLIDSRTILDQGGAENLLGSGDMLFVSQESNKPTRLQSAFISEEEMKKVVGYLKKQTEAHELDSINLDGGGEGGGSPDAFFDSTIDDEDDDDLYEEAKQVVLEAGKASTSYLQRKLRVGYSRAARLIDMLEERGVIGPADGSKPRDVIGGGGGGESEDETS